MPLNSGHGVLKFLANILQKAMRFVSFSKEESVIYRTLERHFRERINRHFAEGTAQKNYSMFMVLLLRLRQCTARKSENFIYQCTTNRLCQDPFLLETTLKQILSLGEIYHLKAELKKLSQDKKPFYEQIDQWVPRAQEEQSGVLERGELLEEGTSFGRSDFGKHFCMDEYFDALHTKEARERVLCGICSDVVVDPQITDVSAHGIGFLPCANEMLVQPRFLRELPYEPYA